jgi:hypothetical protein
VVEAFTAAARGQPAAALRHARATLGHARALGISHEYLRWAWPLAARVAHDLADTATTTTELIALLDRYRPGQLAPMLRAERALARPAAPPPTAAQTPARPSPPRSPACGSTPPPTTWPTASSTTPNTSPGSVRPGPPEQPSARPALSPAACTASHCSTARDTTQPATPHTTA